MKKDILFLLPFSLVSPSFQMALEEKGETLVLVSGASGFVASHCVLQLLSAGYTVRGTVRSLKNEAKVAFLRGLPHAQQRLQLVEADLEDEKSWIPAVAGCKYVLHVASPFPMENPQHEDDLIRPAVKGTLSVLQAAAESGCVARVVLTSSVVAINSMAGDAHATSKEKGTAHVFTEDDWTDVSKAPPYAKSKVLAEAAAWKVSSRFSLRSLVFSLFWLFAGFIVLCA